VKRCELYQSTDRMRKRKRGWKERRRKIKGWIYKPKLLK
jgi:hypothetical protein